MDKKVIVDNDLFVILAGAGLFEDWLAACKISFADVHILPPLQKMLCKRKGKLSRNHCRETLDAAQLIAERLTPLPVADNDALAVFNGIPGIDIGEQQIFAHLATRDFIFAGTNDKRSIRALAAKSDLSAMVGNKIICLEQAICALIDHKGWAAVNAAVSAMFKREKLAGKNPDTSLQCIFSQYAPSEQNTREALNSGLRQLLTGCSAVLHPEWRESAF